MLNKGAELQDNPKPHCEKPEKLTVDEFLQRIGEFESSQKLLLLFFSFLLVPSAFPVLSITFVGLNPPWECVHNNNECNWTGYFDVGDNFYPQRCKMNRTSWKYKSPRSLSIVTEWDLICDKKTFSYIASSSIFVGLILSGIVLGAVCDRYGRKVVLFPCIGILLLSTFASAFAPNVWILLVLRVLQGIGKSGTTVTIFVMASELVGPSKRGLVSSMPWVPNGVGLMLLPLFAFLFPNWRHLQIVLSAPYVVVFVVYRFIPESIRWLHVNNKTVEAEAILKKIAKNNKVPFPNAELVKLPKVRITGSYLDIFTPRSQCLSSLVMAYVWYTNALMFYGISIAANRIGGSVYRDFALIILTSFPGIALSVLCSNRFGRKPTTICSMFFSGVLCGAIGFVPTNSPNQIVYWSRIGIALVATLLNNVSYATIYVWSAELYPTVTRSRGIGWLVFCSRVAGASAPWIAQMLGHFGAMLPFLVMGIATVLATFLAFLLKETLNSPTKETVIGLADENRGGNETSEEFTTKL